MTTTLTKPTKTIAKKVLSLIDAGLCSGLGSGAPGDMCVEAAVCQALGLPHGDDPKCVDPAVRAFKIALNDANGWSSKAARANGLRRAGIAQLGSLGTIDAKLFAETIAEQTIRIIVPIALRAAASLLKDKGDAKKLNDAADACEKEGTYAAAYAARAAAYAARAAADAAAYAAKDYLLSVAAEIAVQALTKHKSPGAKHLDLAPLKLPPCPQGIKPYEVK